MNNVKQVFHFAHMHIIWLYVFFLQFFVVALSGMPSACACIVFESLYVLYAKIIDKQKPKERRTRHTQSHLTVAW